MAAQGPYNALISVGVDITGAERNLGSLTTKIDEIKKSASSLSEGIRKSGGLGDLAGSLNDLRGIEKTFQGIAALNRELGSTFSSARSGAAGKSGRPSVVPGDLSRVIGEAERVNARLDALLSELPAKARLLMQTADQLKSGVSAMGEARVATGDARWTRSMPAPSFTTPTLPTPTPAVRSAAAAPPTVDPWAAARDPNPTRMPGSLGAGATRTYKTPGDNLQGYLASYPEQITSFLAAKGNNPKAVTRALNSGYFNLKDAVDIGAQHKLSSEDLDRVWRAMKQSLLAQTGASDTKELGQLLATESGNGPSAALEQMVVQAQRAAAAKFAQLKGLPNPGLAIAAKTFGMYDQRIKDGASFKLALNTHSQGENARGERKLSELMQEFASLLPAEHVEALRDFATANGLNKGGNANPMTEIPARSAIMSYARRQAERAGRPDQMTFAHLGQFVSPTNGASSPYRMERGSKVDVPGITRSAEPSPNAKPDFLYPLPVYSRVGGDPYYTFIEQETHGTSHDLKGQSSRTLSNAGTHEAFGVAPYNVRDVTMGAGARVFGPGDTGRRMALGAAMGQLPEAQLGPAAAGVALALSDLPHVESDPSSFAYATTRTALARASIGEYLATQSSEILKRKHSLEHGNIHLAAYPGTLTPTREIDELTSLLSPGGVQNLGPERVAALRQELLQRDGAEPSEVDLHREALARSGTNLSAAMARSSRQFHSGAPANLLRELLTGTGVGEAYTLEQGQRKSQSADAWRMLSVGAIEADAIPGLMAPDSGAGRTAYLGLTYGALARGIRKGDIGEPNGGGVQLDEDTLNMAGADLIARQARLRTRLAGAATTDEFRSALTDISAEVQSTQTDENGRAINPVNPVANEFISAMSRKLAVPVEEGGLGGATILPASLKTLEPSALAQAAVGRMGLRDKLQGSSIYAPYLWSSKHLETARGTFFTGAGSEALYSELHPAYEAIAKTEEGKRPSGKHQVYGMMRIAGQLADSGRLPELVQGVDEYRGIAESLTQDGVTEAEQQAIIARLRETEFHRSVAPLYEQVKGQRLIQAPTPGTDPEGYTKLLGRVGDRLATQFPEDAQRQATELDKVRKHLQKVEGTSVGASLDPDAYTYWAAMTAKPTHESEAAYTEGLSHVSGMSLEEVRANPRAAIAGAVGSSPDKLVDFDRLQTVIREVEQEWLSGNEYRSAALKFGDVHARAFAGEDLSEAIRDPEALRQHLRGMSVDEIKQFSATLDASGMSEVANIAANPLGIQQINEHAASMRRAAEGALPAELPRDGAPPVPSPAVEPVAVAPVAPAGRQRYALTSRLQHPGLFSVIAGGASGTGSGLVAPLQQALAESRRVTATEGVESLFSVGPPRRRDGDETGQGRVLRHGVGSQTDVYTAENLHAQEDVLDDNSRKLIEILSRVRGIRRTADMADFANVDLAGESSDPVSAQARIDLARALDTPEFDQLVRNATSRSVRGKKDRAVNNDAALRHITGIVSSVMGTPPTSGQGVLKVLGSTFFGDDQGLTHTGALGAPQDVYTTPLMRETLGDAMDMDRKTFLSRAQDLALAAGVPPDGAAQLAKGMALRLSRNAQIGLPDAARAGNGVQEGFYDGPEAGAGSAAERRWSRGSLGEYLGRVYDKSPAQINNLAQTGVAQTAAPLVHAVLSSDGLSPEAWDQVIAESAPGNERKPEALAAAVRANIAGRWTDESQRAADAHSLVEAEAVQSAGAVHESGASLGDVQRVLTPELSIRGNLRSQSPNELMAQLDATPNVDYETLGAMASHLGPAQAGRVVRSAAAQNLGAGTLSNPMQFGSVAGLITDTLDRTDPRARNEWVHSHPGADQAYPSLQDLDQLYSAIEQSTSTNKRGQGIGLAGGAFSITDGSGGLASIRFPATMLQDRQLQFLGGMRAKMAELGDSGPAFDEAALASYADMTHAGATVHDTPWVTRGDAEHGQQLIAGPFNLAAAAVTGLQQGMPEEELQRELRRVYDYRRPGPESFYQATGYTPVEEGSFYSLVQAQNAQSAHHAPAAVSSGGDVPVTEPGGPPVAPPVALPVTSGRPPAAPAGPDVVPPITPGGPPTPDRPPAAPPGGPPPAPPPGPPTDGGPPSSGWNESLIQAINRLSNVGERWEQALLGFTGLIDAGLVEPLKTFSSALHSPESVASVLKLAQENRRGGSGGPDETVTPTVVSGGAGPEADPKPTKSGGTARLATMDEVRTALSEHQKSFDQFVTQQYPEATLDDARKQGAVEFPGFSAKAIFQPGGNTGFGLPIEMRPNAEGRVTPGYRDFLRVSSLDEAKTAAESLTQMHLGGIRDAVEQELAGASRKDINAEIARRVKDAGLQGQVVGQATIGHRGETSQVNFKVAGHRVVQEPRYFQGGVETVAADDLDAFLEQRGKAERERTAKQLERIHGRAASEDEIDQRLFERFGERSGAVSIVADGQTPRKQNTVIGLGGRVELEDRRGRGAVGVNGLSEVIAVAERITRREMGDIIDTVNAQMAGQSQNLIDAEIARQASARGLVGAKYGRVADGSGPFASQYELINTGTRVEAVAEGTKRGNYDTSHEGLPGLLQTITQQQRALVGRDLEREFIDRGLPGAATDAEIERRMLERSGREIATANVHGTMGAAPERRRVIMGPGGTVIDAPMGKEALAGLGGVREHLAELDQSLRRQRALEEQTSARMGPAIESPLQTQGVIDRQDMTFAGGSIPVNFIRTASGEHLASPQAKGGIFSLPYNASENDIQSLVRMQGEEIQRALAAARESNPRVWQDNRTYGQTSVQRVSESGIPLWQEQWNHVARNGQIVAQKEPDHMQFARAGGDFSNAIEKVGLWTATTGAVYGFIAAIKGAFDLMRQFDEQMATSKVLMGASTNFERLRNEFTSVARDYGQSVLVVASAGHLWERQYKDVNTVMNLTRETIKLSKVDNIDLAQSNKYLEATINEFGMAADDASRVVDSWTKVTNNAQVTLEDLADGLTRAGGSARLAGVSFDELNGLVAAGVRATGARGHEVGNMLKTVFGRMYSPDSASQLSAVGIPTHEVVNGIEELRPAGKILDELAAKWHGLSRAQQQSLSMSMAGGVRQWSRLAALMNDYGTAQRAASESSDAFGAAQREVGIRLDTLQGQLSKLMASTQSFASAAFFQGGVLPAARTSVSGLQGGMDFLTNRSPRTQAAIGTGATMAAYLAAGNLMGKVFGQGPIFEFGNLGGAWQAGRRPTETALEEMVIGSEPAAAAGTVARAGFRQRLGGFLNFRETGTAMTSAWQQGGAYAATLPILQRSAAPAAAAEFKGVAGILGGATALSRTLLEVVSHFAKLALVVGAVVVAVEAWKAVANAFKPQAAKDHDKALEDVQKAGKLADALDQYNALTTQLAGHEGRTDLSTLANRLSLSETIQKETLSLSQGKGRTLDPYDIVSSASRELLTTSQSGVSAIIAAATRNRNWDELSVAQTQLRPLLTARMAGESTNEARTNRIAEQVFALESKGVTNRPDDPAMQSVYGATLNTVAMQYMRDVTERFGVPHGEVNQARSTDEIWAALQQNKAVIDNTSQAGPAFAASVKQGDEALLQVQRGETERLTYIMQKTQSGYRPVRLGEGEGSAVGRNYATPEDFLAALAQQGYAPTKTLATGEETQLVFDRIRTAGDVFKVELERLARATQRVGQVLTSVPRLFRVLGQAVGAGEGGAAEFALKREPMAQAALSAAAAKSMYLEVLPRRNEVRGRVADVTAQLQNETGLTAGEVKEMARKEHAEVKKEGSAGGRGVLWTNLGELLEEQKQQDDLAQSALNTNRENVENVKAAVEELQQLQDTTLELHGLWRGVADAVERSRDAAWALFNAEEKSAERHEAAQMEAAVGLGGTQFEDWLSEARDYQNGARQAIGQIATAQGGGRTALGRAFGEGLPAGIALPGFARGRQSGFDLLASQLGQVQGDIATVDNGPEAVLDASAAMFFKAATLFAESVAAMTQGGSGGTVVNPRGYAHGGSVASGSVAADSGRIAGVDKKKSVDPILAWLNPGEYVVPAGMAAVIGDKLEGARKSGSTAQALDLRDARGFAGGGRVWRRVREWWQTGDADEDADSLSPAESPATGSRYRATRGGAGGRTTTRTRVPGAAGVTADAPPTGGSYRATRGGAGGRTTTRTRVPDTPAAAAEVPAAAPTPAPEVAAAPAGPSGARWPAWTLPEETVADAGQAAGAAGRVAAAEGPAWWKTASGKAELALTAIMALQGGAQQIQQNMDQGKSPLNWDVARRAAEPVAAYGGMKAAEAMLPRMFPSLGRAFGAGSQALGKVAPFIAAPLGYLEGSGGFGLGQEQIQAAYEQGRMKSHGRAFLSGTGDASISKPFWSWMAKHPTVAKWAAAGTMALPGMQPMAAGLYAAGQWGKDPSVVDALATATDAAAYTAMLFVPGAEPFGVAGLASLVGKGAGRTQESYTHKYDPANANAARAGVARNLAEQQRVRREEYDRRQQQQSANQASAVGGRAAGAASDSAQRQQASALLASISAQQKLMAAEINRALAASITEFHQQEGEIRERVTEASVGLLIGTQAEVFSGTGRLGRMWGTRAKPRTGIGQLERAAITEQSIYQLGLGAQFGLGGGELAASLKQQATGGYRQFMGQSIEQFGRLSASGSDDTRVLGASMLQAARNLDKFGTPAWDEITRGLPARIREAMTTWARNATEAGRVTAALAERADILTAHQKVGDEATGLLGGQLSTGKRIVGSITATQYANSLMSALAPGRARTPFEMQGQAAEQATEVLGRGLAELKQQEHKGKTQYDQDNARSALRAMEALARGDMKTYQGILANQNLSPETKTAITSLSQAAQVANWKPPRRGETQEQLLSAAYGVSDDLLQWTLSPERTNYLAGAGVSMAPVYETSGRTPGQPLTLGASPEYLNRYGDEISRGWAGYTGAYAGRGFLGEPAYLGGNMRDTGNPPATGGDAAAPPTSGLTVSMADIYNAGFTGPGAEAALRGLEINLSGQGNGTSDAEQLGKILKEYLDAALISREAANTQAQAAQTMRENAGKFTRSAQDHLQGSEYLASMSQFRGPVFHGAQEIIVGP